MKYLISVFVLALLSACIREEDTYYRATLKNATGHSILVLPFKDGVVFPTDTIRLSPEQELLIGEGSSRGVQNHAGFYSKVLAVGNRDSVVVIFDDTYRVVHFIDIPGTAAVKHIDYQSTRNIENYLSYDYSYEDVSKYSRKAFYTYVFEEADYQYARQ